MKIIHRNDSIHTPRSRDAAIRRLDNTSRWLIAGSAVLTGVLTDVAANAFPGHAKPKAASAGHSHAKHKPLSPPKEAPKTTTTEQAPPPASESSVAPAEETTAPETTQTTPAQEAAPQPAPVEETQQAPTPEQREALPPPEEPVVSGGS